MAKNNNQNRNLSEGVSAAKRQSEDLLRAMENFITTKSVVGEPVTVGDSVIIPLADVSFGMGLGTFSKGGNGTGGVSGKITPSAVLVIKNGSSKIINVKDTDGLSKIMDLVPDVVDKFTSRGKSDDLDIEGDFK